MSSLIDKECIIFDIDPKEKNAVIKQMVKKLKERNKIDDEENFYKDVLDREKLSPTAIGYDIGLPHGKSDSVIEPSICFGVLKNPVTWNEETGEVAKIVVMIAVPKYQSGDLHIKILSKLARKLMHEEFRNDLLNPDKEFIYNLLKDVLEG